ncbi:MAG TPA: DUF1460 domain-containing protein [Prolixibacteraceae bacterium]|nr:DUF1460 domain-containing protein [Prolixibacteraceae bacterium]
MSVRFVYRLVPALVFLGFFLGCKRPISVAQQSRVAIYTPADSLMVVAKMKEMEHRDPEALSRLFVDVARSFLGTPYAGQTLELGEDESLVVNLREFDCTTFIETCMALTFTVASGKNEFSDFLDYLQQIRYRNGHVDGYLSRLHYFSEWIMANQARGYLRDVSREKGGALYTKDFHFMSRHVSAYKQLAADSSLLPPLRQIENNLSSQTHYFIPKDQVPGQSALMEDGMIVAFTTGLDGLDVIHTGILVSVGEEMHVLHASSDAGKVILSEKSLTAYLEGNKLQTGIVLVKLQNQ